MNKDQTGTRIEGVHFVIQSKSMPGAMVNITPIAVYCPTLTRARAIAKLGTYGSCIIRPANGERYTVVAQVSGHSDPTNMYGSPKMHGSKGPKRVR